VLYAGHTRRARWTLCDRSTRVRPCRREGQRGASRQRRTKVPARGKPLSRLDGAATLSNPRFVRIRAWPIRG